MTLARHFPAASSNAVAFSDISNTIACLLCCCSSPHVSPVPLPVQRDNTTFAARASALHSGVRSLEGERDWDSEADASS